MLPGYDAMGYAMSKPYLRAQLEADLCKLVIHVLLCATLLLHLLYYFCILLCCCKISCYLFGIICFVTLSPVIYVITVYCTLQKQTMQYN